MKNKKGRPAGRAYFEQVSLRLTVEDKQNIEYLIENIKQKIGYGCSITASGLIRGLIAEAAAELKNKE